MRADYILYPTIVVNAVDVIEKYEYAIVYHHHSRSSLGDIWTKQQHHNHTMSPSPMFFLSTLW